MPSDSASGLAERLATYLGRRRGRVVRVTGLTRLAGGVSRETWAFDLDDAGATSRALVLRMDTPHPFIAGSRTAEAALMSLARQHGVPVPQVLWSEADTAVLGGGFLIMERLSGESRVGPLLSDARYAAARAGLLEQAAQALARIHRIVPAHDPAGATGLRQFPPAEAVADLDALYREHAVEPHPALELGLRWLPGHLPPATPLALVHGDFRPGNLLYDETGLRAVLDWELASFGDPLADVAWVALRSWRGGRDDQAVGGLGPREAFHRAYEGAGGRMVEPVALHFWDVFATVRWGIVTLMELGGFLGGMANIELASLGRRTAEIEWDLLSLLEEAD